MNVFHRCDLCVKGEHLALHTHGSKLQAVWSPVGAAAATCYHWRVLAYAYLYLKQPSSSTTAETWRYEVEIVFLQSSALSFGALKVTVKGN